MKRFLTLSTVLFWAMTASLLAQGPDDQYVRIYNMIHQADNLAQSGQGRAAYEKYRSAQDALNSMSITFPSWNPKLIEYRLDYVAQKLSQFGPPPDQTPDTPSDQVEKPQQPATNLVSQLPDLTPPPAVTELQNKVSGLTEENRRLQADKATLEAKLREALSAQPATVNPGQLSKAEATIVALQKENALLKVSLEKAEAKLKAPADAADLNAAQQALADANTKLAQQTQLIATLQQEIAVLKAHSGAPADSGPLKQLKAENEQLKKRVKELESRSPASSGADARQLKKLEKERDDLRAKLAEANKKISGSRSRRESTRVKQLNEQLNALQATIDAFESKKVPYTPEELALFKEPEKITVAAQPSAEQPAQPAKRSPNNIPVGAGALVAEAHRAFAAGRYDEAEQKFQQVLSMDEKNITTLGNLATIALQRDQLDAAEKYLRQALTMEPNDAVNLSLWGITKFRQDKYDDALEALSRAVKLDPENPESQNYLGITLSQKGQRDPAETALRKAIQLNPNYGSAHQNLAVVYATQKPPFMELARYHYLKALGCGQPKNPSLEKMLEGK